MSIFQHQILDKELHANAETLIAEYSSDFTTALILQSKTLAKMEGTDEVQSVHVVRAKGVVLTLSQKKDDRKTLFFGIGCTLFGVALQGVIAEYLSPTPKLGWFLLYAILGMVSMFVVSQMFKIESN